MKLLRLRAGYTQEELAEELGVSKTCINHWECRKDYPNEHRLRQLADFFDCSLAYLQGYGDSPAKCKTQEELDEEYNRRLAKANGSWRPQ